MPKFSIIVPTVNRPETLVHCLRTIVEQKAGDFEIIVSDNQGPQDNQRIVESFHRPDILKYHRTPEQLGMRGNYEHSISLASGQYISILGDDDGFALNGLEHCRSILDQAQPDVLFWFPHLYWWPNAVLPWRQWMLYIHARPAAAHQVDAMTYVDALFQRQQEVWRFERLPSIYNGFVSRELLERIRARTGQYFCDEIPDIYSGIVNGVMARSAIVMDRPATIRGLSGKSYGTAFRRRQGTRELQEFFKKHMKSPMCEPDLVDSTALAVHVASVRLRAIRRFAELSNYQINIMDVMAGIFGEINEDVERYDDLLADARTLAEKYSLTWSDVTVPPRPAANPVKNWGISFHGDQRGATLSIHGEALGLDNIYRAAQAVESILG